MGVHAGRCPLVCATRFDKEPGVGVYAGHRPDIMALVATAAAVDRPNASDIHGRPTLVSVGTIVWLSSELMFFAALFAIYFTIRQVAPELWESQPNLLNIPFSATNTIVLVLSSITCQLGVLAAERGQVGRLGSVFDVPRWGLREWFILTFLMGASSSRASAMSTRRLFRKVSRCPRIPGAPCSTSLPVFTHFT